MSKFIALTTALTLSLAPMAMAEDLKIAEIEVKSELADVTDSNALQFWPEIESDLKTAVEAALVPMLDENGDDVVVSLSEVSLSGSAVLGDAGEFNQMRGWVYVFGDDRSAPKHSFEVILSAQSAAVGSVPENTIIIPVSDADFYNVLIAAFATSTAEKLGEIDAPVTDGTEEVK